MTGARLYSRLIGASIRSQMQYRASFLMASFGQFAGTGIEILGIWVLFARFGKLGSWRLAEAAMFYGLINIAFAIADGFARGFDVFSNFVKRGDFDRILLRPRSSALQVAGTELFLTRIGRIVQASIVLAWSASALEVEWTASRVGLATISILGGVALFYGLFVLQATAAFWTTETLEIMNAFTYGGVQTAQLPMSIYRPWFRKVFTYIVPLACVNYYPTLAILDRIDPDSHMATLAWITPWVGFVFCLMSLHVWRIGVRHYRSTGS